MLGGPLAHGAGQHHPQAQPHVSVGVGRVPDHHDVLAPAVQLWHVVRRRFGGVDEQADGSTTVAPGFVSFLERLLEGVGAARLGFDHDAGIGGGGIRPERDDEVTHLASRDDSARITDGLEHITRGIARPDQLITNQQLELVAVRGRAALGRLAGRQALQHHRHLGLEFTGLIGLGAVVGIQPLHQAVQARLGVVERELRTDLRLRRLHTPDQPRQGRIFLVERELLGDRRHALADTALEVAMPGLEFLHQPAQCAVGPVERELTGDGLGLRLERLRHLGAHHADEGVAFVGTQQRLQRALLAEVLGQQFAQGQARRCDLLGDHGGELSVVAQQALHSFGEHAALRIEVAAQRVVDALVEQATVLGHALFERTEEPVALAADLRTVDRAPGCTHRQDADLQGGQCQFLPLAAVRGVGQRSHGFGISDGQVQVDWLEA